MSGRLRKRAEVAVAVAVDSRRRHQRDQALGQLKRRQEQLAVPARTGFRAAAGGRSCCLPSRRFRSYRRRFNLGQYPV